MKGSFKTALIAAVVSAFVAAGAAVATTQTFTLGTTNTVDAPSTVTAGATGLNAKMLQLTNNNTGSSATALGLTTPSSRPPMTVSSDARVANLNADKIDGIDSAGFLRKGVTQSAVVTAAGGVVDVKNTGTTNGVQGITVSATASGVYGQNTSGNGFGVAGRAGSGGYGIYGDNTGSGFAGYFEDKVYLGGDLVCSGCVSTGDIAGDFVQGAGKAGGQAIAESPGEHFFLGPPFFGFLRLSYQCPVTLTNFGFFNVYNDSGSVANVFIESGEANPTYSQMAAGGHIQLPAAPTGDSFHIQAQGAPGIMTMEAATVNRASDCHAQAQALLTG
jgi:hypothetical protein